MRSAATFTYPNESLVTEDRIGPLVGAAAAAGSAAGGVFGVSSRADGIVVVALAVAGATMLDGAAVLLLSVVVD